MTTVKIDVCPGDDLQAFYPSEADAECVGRSKLIQTNLINWSRRWTFHELNALSSVRLMKSSTFGLGLTDILLLLNLTFGDSSIYLVYQLQYILASQCPPKRRPDLSKNRAVKFGHEFLPSFVGKEHVTKPQDQRQEGRSKSVIVFLGAFRCWERRKKKCIGYKKVKGKNILMRKYK